MRKLSIKLIKFYQTYISRRIGSRCKFIPSCSEYTLQAITKYGFLKGVFLGFKRIIKCHPFSKGGYDPLK